uniref:DUF6598 domain-containing protein n=1 Tax=Oryza punctata TaxID=4537 RepID=A0A0E0MIM8_ORYPU
MVGGTAVVAMAALPNERWSRPPRSRRRDQWWSRTNNFRPKIDRISFMATRRGDVEEGDLRKKKKSSDRAERIMRDLLMMQRLDEEEEEEYQKEDYEIVMFRRSWTTRHARNFGSFDDTTTYPAMRYTSSQSNSSSATATPDTIISSGHFMSMALSLPPRRNLLFNRTRDNCQILTQQDPFLVLTGPSRAIILIDPVQFEVQLKAKSNNNTLHDHPDQDQIVNFGVVDSGYFPWPTTYCTGKRSEVEFTIAVLDRSIEATITSVQLVGGSSWPDHFPGRLVSRTASTFHQQIVLLDSQKQEDGKMPIDDGGFIQLSRRVVSVELAGQLIVEVLAFNAQQQQQHQVVDNDNKDEIVAKCEIVFKPQKASLSVETCELQLGGEGLLKLQISVAWSLVDRMPIDDDGFIQLSRRVVSVELAGQLIVEVLAFNSQQQQHQVVDNDNDDDQGRS